MLSTLPSASASSRKDAGVEEVLNDLAIALSSASDLSCATAGDTPAIPATDASVVASASTSVAASATVAATATPAPVCGEGVHYPKLLLPLVASGDVPASVAELLCQLMRSLKGDVLTCEMKATVA